MALVEWNTRIVIRNDSYENWSIVNPVLIKGELGVVIGTKPQIKVGDGVTHWNDLPFINDLGDYYTKAEINELVSHLENYYSKAEIDAEFSKYYTKADIDGKHYVNDTYVNKVTANLASKDEVAAIDQSVRAVLGGNAKYEVLPVDGLIVDYRDTEVRLNTSRVTPVHQNVGSTGNPNMFYVTFKAYAPEGAVSVIEGNNNVMDAESSSLQTDAHGRKYAVIWSAIANYANGIWTKWGDNSTVDKYFGFLYSFHWLNSDGQIIRMDKVRVLLTNDQCHTDLVPDVVARSIDAKIQAALKGATNLENYYTKTEADERFLTETEVDAHINKIITDAVDGDTLTTLTELVEYINTHDTDILVDIKKIEKQLVGIGSEEGAVKNAIDAAIVELNIDQYAKVETVQEIANIIYGDENTEGTIKNQIKAVQDLIPTTADMQNIVTSYGYTTSENVETLIQAHNFTTKDDVDATLKLYATTDMISDMATKTWVSEEMKDCVQYTDEVVLNGGAA